MSEKILDDLNKAVNSDREYLLKEKELKQARIDYQYNQKLERENDKKLLDSLNLDNIGEQYITDLVESLDDYFRDCTKSKVFINNSFRGIVPFFRKNIVLVGALSGSGKSTATANVAVGTILQGEKCLVFTNEEAPEDVYGRVVALIKGWAYTKHENFTEDQKRITKEMMPILSQRMLVIGPNFMGMRDVTTSLEGIEGILNSIEKNGNKFGSIVFDYYQNINKSRENPSATSNEVSERFSKMIDQFKNRYEAPIVVMSQLMPSGKKDSPLAFRDRIEGRKIIYNVCTVGIELRANRENGTSEFVFHKSRFNEFIGKSVVCGFNRGKFVKHDGAFIVQQEKETLQNLKKEVDERNKT